ncbi:hypothetical protein PIB30_103965, partial [Stylosanthes scabra]|nr:hypothetical protein [Stylosanthes scabra]
YYPRFVAAAYTTISIFDTLRADGTGDFRFRFKLGGREYILTLQHLADIWGLLNEGATFKSGNNPHGTWDEFDKLEAAEFLNLGPAATASLGLAHLWTRILESLDFDLTRERVIEPSKVNAITRKNINQMRRNLLGLADEGGDDEDEAMEDVPPTFGAGTSSQSNNRPPCITTRIIAIDKIHTWFFGFRVCIEA